MGYFQVSYNARVVNYDHRGFIGLTTGLSTYKIDTVKGGEEPAWPDGCIYFSIFCLLQL